MFVVYKLIKALILPPALITLGMVFALFCLYRQRIRMAKYALVATAVFYYLLSIEPTAFVLTRSLMRGAFSAAPPAIFFETLKENPPEAIVVLAGGVNKKDKTRPFAELSGASWRRLWRGLEVYRQLDSKVPILYSGDSGDPFEAASGEALLARSYALAMGVPESGFLVETKSRTTAESGFAVKRVLDETFPENATHRVILVTSSWHLPRAAKVFEREGVEIIASPADFPTAANLTLDPFSFIPSVEHFASSYFAIHEWIGIGAYWIMSGLNISSFDTSKGI